MPLQRGRELSRGSRPSGEEHTAGPGGAESSQLRGSPEQTCSEAGSSPQCLCCSLLPFSPRGSRRLWPCRQAPWCPALCCVTLSRQAAAGLRGQDPALPDMLIPLCSFRPKLRSRGGTAGRPEIADQDKLTGGWWLQAVSHVQFMMLMVTGAPSSWILMEAGPRHRLHLEDKAELRDSFLQAGACGRLHKLFK